MNWTRLLVETWYLHSISFSVDFDFQYKFQLNESNTLECLVCPVNGISDHRKKYQIYLLFEKPFKVRKKLIQFTRFVTKTVQMPNVARNGVCKTKKMKNKTNNASISNFTSCRRGEEENWRSWKVFFLDLSRSFLIIRIIQWVRARIFLYIPSMEF